MNWEQNLYLKIDVNPQRQNLNIDATESTQFIFRNPNIEGDWDSTILFQVDKLNIFKASIKLKKYMKFSWIIVFQDNILFV